MAFTDYHFQKIWTQVDSANTTAEVTDLPASQRPTRGVRKYEFDPAETASWRKLVFAKLDAAGATVASDLVYWGDAAHITVTINEAVSVSALNGPAGVAIGAVSASSYGWFLTCGDVTLNLAAAANPAAGDAIIGSATNKKVNSVAANTAPTNKVVGWATAAASGAGGTVRTWVEIEC